MISLDDIKLMNEALIAYYKELQNEKKVLKHTIIQEVLSIENCFNKMDKEEAIKILRDIGVSEDKLDNIYQEISAQMK